MPTATFSTQTIQRMRDPSYYFKAQKKRQRSKPGPWVDVSDDDSKGNKNRLKRKNSLVNGHSDHFRQGQNGHKHKKRRHSVNGVDSSEPIEFSSNSPGPSHPKKSQVNGAGPSTPHGARSKAIQEQRAQLPIAKGKDALIEEIRKNEVTILLGETGSGKTTRKPVVCLKIFTCQSFCRGSSIHPRERPS
ncbi:hypothetical protein CPB84DRAFT_697913 [Gymnopilus junonius]|uniref:Uncharacterized protein n=1 Tax=Gymnopilus junonius TaxID=109634 RepID=A0A9P5NPA9_GYMJU|nr:hypothetical protein CPB84DRAFT_697913 [Gymnopilus junonius]